MTTFKMAAKTSFHVRPPAPLAAVCISETTSTEP